MAKIKTKYILIGAGVLVLWLAMQQPKTRKTTPPPGKYTDPEPQQVPPSLNGALGVV